MIINTARNSDYYDPMKKCVHQKRVKHMGDQIQQLQLRPEKTQYQHVLHILQTLTKSGSKQMQKLYEVSHDKQTIHVVAEYVNGVSLTDFINSISDKQNSFIDQYYNLVQSLPNQIQNQMTCPIRFLSNEKLQYFTDNICSLSQMIFSHTSTENTSNTVFQSQHNEFVEQTQQHATIDEIHQILCQLIQLLISLLKLNLPLQHLLKIDKLRVIRDKNNHICLKLIDYFDTESLIFIIQHQQQRKKHSQFAITSENQQIYFKELFSPFKLIFISEYKRYGLISENVDKINKYGYLLDHQLNYRTVYLLQKLYTFNGKIGQLNQLLETQKQLPTLSLSDVINIKSRSFYVKVMVDGDSYEQIQSFINKLTGSKNQEQDIYTTILTTHSLNIQLIIYNKQNFIKQQLIDVAKNIDICIQLYSTQQQYDTLNSKLLDIRTINSHCDFFQLYIYNEVCDKRLQLYAHQSLGQFTKHSLVQACLIYFIYITYTNKRYQ